MVKSPYIKAGFVIWVVIACVSSLLPAASIGNENPGDSAKRRRVKAMYAGYKKTFPEVPDLSAERVLKLTAERQVVFVDVREPEEQAISMLPGAIADSEFLQNPAAYKEQVVIGYCTISYRSGRLAQDLPTRGIRMLNLRGGILAWLHAGGKVYKDGEPVNRVHVYGKKWDLAPSAIETVW